jgi:hypothetical protein
MSRLVFLSVLCVGLASTVFGRPVVPSIENLSDFEKMSAKILLFSLRQKTAERPTAEQPRGTSTEATTTTTEVAAEKFRPEVTERPKSSKSPKSSKPKANGDDVAETLRKYVRL